MKKDVKEKMSPKDIVKNLNAKLGIGSACFLQGDDDSITTVPVVSTGVLAIDGALIAGGLPKGRICEFFGPEGSGKSTVALMAVAACQRNGGICAYIDMEHALDPSLAASCGVNMKTLIFSQPDSGDAAFNTIDYLLNTNEVDLIVFDSVAALSFKEELEDDKFIGDQSAKVGIIARKMSAALRQFTTKAARAGTTLLFINQLRTNITMGYSAGPTDTTPGGRALKFYSSVRLEIKRGKQIKNKDNIIGHELFVKVVKNKMAPPFRTAHCSLIYGKGIPEAESLISLAVAHNILTRRGPWVYWGEEKISQGVLAAAERLNNEPDLKDRLEKAVRDSFGVFSTNSFNHGNAGADVEDDIPEELAEIEAMGEEEDGEIE